MAEKIVSPGVFTRENDLSFIQAGVEAIGGAIVGPTARGPVLVPTEVNTYAEFVQIFGESYESGSSTYQFFTSIAAKEYLKHNAPLTVCRVGGDNVSKASGSFSGSTGLKEGCPATGSATGTDAAFVIKTLGEGDSLNSSHTNGEEGTNNVLENGTKNNFRWEITGANSTKGTFNLLIRRGDDTSKRKVILEQFNGLTMDPNDANYIGQRIGTQEFAVRGDATDGYYLQPTGSFPNRSKYIFIEESSIKNIPNFLDENGTITDAAVALTGSSFPGNKSGSFEGGSDDYQHPMKFYNEIADANIQGLVPNTDAQGKTAYTKALGLLTNPDEFDINVIACPGLVSEGNYNSDLIDTALIEAVENRGDCIAVVDPVYWNKGIADATAQADTIDSSYAAMYWPWVQIQNAVLGNYIWVPQSTLIPAVYAQSDALAHEWFAPAGLNRGGLSAAIQAERKLTHANRDTLYEANVNPIATFPGEGVVVFGQKTLQKKASALDRVNVRRLLINLKKFISGVSKFLVFENNTAATRNRFLSQVEPYMQTVQEQQGLYAFRVQMDDLNNTPDVIDRNQMKGAIFIQPAKAAEFIIIDFNILPTGATFDD